MRNTPLAPFAFCDCFFKNILLRVCLHVTEIKSHSGIKKFLFTCEFHSGMKRVESQMKFNLKENLPMSMKSYKKTYHFSFIC